MATATALFIVPPGTGLWVPAHTAHVTRMPSGLAMRGLFLREDAARAGPDRVTVVAISPLLRALILAACEQPVMWDEDGPVRHVVALALHGIGHANEALVAEGDAGADQRHLLTATELRLQWRCPVVHRRPLKRCQIWHG